MICCATKNKTSTTREQNTHEKITLPTAPWTALPTRDSHPFNLLHRPLRQHSLHEIDAHSTSFLYWKTSLQACAEHYRCSHAEMEACTIFSPPLCKKKWKKEKKGEKDEKNNTRQRFASNEWEVHLVNIRMCSECLFHSSHNSQLPQLTDLRTHHRKCSSHSTLSKPITP